MSPALHAGSPHSLRGKARERVRAKVGELGGRMGALCQGLLLPSSAWTLPEGAQKLEGGDTLLIKLRAPVDTQAQLASCRVSHGLRALVPSEAAPSQARSDARPHRSSWAAGRRRRQSRGGAAPCW